MFRTSRSKVGKPVLLGLTATGAALVLAGCSAELETGFLPTERDTTDKVNQVIDLWNYSWIAMLAVGIIVWTLIIVSIVAFRRKSKNDPLPAQTQYNVPLEVVYTIIPLFMVGVMFVYTAKVMGDLEARPAEGEPAVHIQALGKRWAWDFNYLDEDVYETTQQLALDGNDIPDDEMPTLYLPVNETVEIQLNARDVMHSFWVPAFLYKKDMVPGVDNFWTFKPTKEGTFAGKCAELCGQYHSEMIFQVKVVDRTEYDAQMAALKDKGQTGKLGMELNPDTPAELAIKDIVGAEGDGE